MGQLDKLSVIVTGTSGLEKTAGWIAGHICRAGKDIPVVVWDGMAPLPQQKPYVLVLEESQLKYVSETLETPDVAVIKDVSAATEEIKKLYQKLYRGVGPQMATILNADDRAVIDLAASDFVRKGKTYYFSKNSGLKPQIKRIGGVYSDGEKIEIYRMNQSDVPVQLNMNEILGHSDEMSYVASLAAVMDLGLAAQDLA